MLLILQFLRFRSRLGMVLTEVDIVDHWKCCYLESNICLPLKKHLMFRIVISVPCIEGALNV
ncbi:hypothetical protein SCA6_011840 [Theobroma cacao]